MSEEDIFGLIVDAYRTGALDVHGNWQEDRDPDFSEAAHDYARDALAAATGTAKTAKQAECEASQSGGEAVTPNTSPISQDSPE